MYPLFSARLPTAPALTAASTASLNLPNNTPVKTALVIFDLDGTLLNTITDIGRACNHALDALGLPTHPIEAYTRMVGNGFRNLVQRASPDSSPELIDRLVALSREYYNDHNTESTAPYPGIPAVLEALVESGTKIAVASNKYISATDKIIRFYFPNTPFVAIEGQREGRPIKPDPSVIFDILNTTGIPAEKAVLIGDSTVDLQTAINAGIRHITVAWGFSPASELKEAGADPLVTTPDQILSLI